MKINRGLDLKLHHKTVEAKKKKKKAKKKDGKYKFLCSVGPLVVLVVGEVCDGERSAQAEDGKDSCLY